MNHLVSVVAVCLLISINSSAQEKKKVAVKTPVIRAVGKQADYAIGGEWVRGNWTISPHIERDTLPVRIYGQKETVIFKTDKDSIRYVMQPGDTRSFFVNLGDTARALTVLHAVAIKQNLTYTKNGNEEDSIRFWYGYEPDKYMEQLETLYPTKHLVKPSNNDLANIAAILGWTHNQWKHNGNKSPKKSDALSILNEVKEGGEFPCFAFSIVLAGKLNAAGYKSRVLYLKAKTVETDRFAPGHVVTETYVPSLGKWIFLDGQFNAMPLLKGVPLNAVEFQKALTDNYNNLRFYNTVNYNTKPYSNREYFDFIYPTLYYYDFRFDSRVDNGIRKAERIRGKTNLMLVPKNAANPTRFGSFDGKIDYCIYTNNASLFYTKPR